MRRSLERVESIKNLLEHDHGVGIVQPDGLNFIDQKADETQDDEEDDGEVKVGEIGETFDRSEIVLSDPKEETPKVMNAV